MISPENFDPDCSDSRIFMNARETFINGDHLLEEGDPRFGTQISGARSVDEHRSDIGPEFSSDGGKRGLNAQVGYQRHRSRILPSTAIESGITTYGIRSIILLIRRSCRCSSVVGSLVE